MIPDFSVYSTYIPLLFSLILVWTDFSLKERFPVWLLFLLLSFISAIFFNYAEIESLLYAAVFALVMKHYYKTGLWGYFFVSLFMCLPLLLHLPFTGFHNYKYLDHVRLTENALPFSLYFNLDKALIGLFVLGFACSKAGVKINFKIVMLYLVFMCAVLLGLALAFSYVLWQPKLPPYTVVWVLVNLFGVSLVEEAFFRKFIQNAIGDMLPGRHAKWMVLVLSSTIFGLAHFQGGVVYVLLATVAGLFYGHIYMKTQRIENAIVLHFLFNLLHFIGFTYPALG